MVHNQRSQASYNFSHDWFSMHVSNFETHVLPMAGVPRRMLEIGSFAGRSTTWLAEHVLTHPDARLDCVDLRLSNVLRQNIELTGRTAQITLHEGKSREVLRKLSLGIYDFIYVDGSHQTIDVLEDAVLVFRLAKPGAIIAFDDYLWDNRPPRSAFGVPKPAIDAFLAIYVHADRYEPVAEVLEHGYQVWIRKLSDETRLKGT